MRPKREPPPGNWLTFYVGDSADFAEEVKAASQNKELMKFLSERTKKSKNGKRTSIEDVRKELGLSGKAKE
jgi:hypothetical protein